MTKIRNVKLGFNCTENLDPKAGDKLFCSKCSSVVIDFTKKTDEELENEINRSATPVCGVFKRSQMSDFFVKYAASPVIATSLTISVFGQGEIRSDSILKANEKLKHEDEDDVFLGTIVEYPSEPIGGYEKFKRAIAANLKYPPGLKAAGKTFVGFTIDTLGHMIDIKILKGFDEAADQEALRVLTSLNYPFKPGRQRNKPVKTKMVIPIIFNPESLQKR